MPKHQFSTYKSYPRAVWRVITQRETDGAMNMAIDEAIAEAVGAGDSLPTLRFYAWDPACLSLGYAQPASDVDFEALNAHGWHAVRRLTGGRAILHVDELTYSVCVPANDPRVAGGVIESYRRLSRGLMRGMELIGAGVRNDVSAEGAGQFKGPVCFEVPSNYEITVEGRKLIGSAQTRRTGQAVLQHGTLPLYGDLTRICDALAFDDESARSEAKKRVLERAITLAEAMGQRVEFHQVAAALTQGFDEALKVTFQAGDLSAAEKAQAEALRANKYNSAAWLQRH